VVSISAELVSCRSVHSGDWSLAGARPASTLRRCDREAEPRERGRQAVVVEREGVAALRGRRSRS